MTRLGIPGQHINTLSYVDSRLSTVPVVDGPRRPLTTDKRYPLWTEWRVKSDALDSSVEGEFWKLIRFESNGDATWVQMCTSSESAVFWEYVSDTTKAAEQNRGYVCDNVAGVDVTLPTSAEFGSLLSLTAEGGAWKLIQGEGQSVIFGDHTTTVGAAGYLESTELGDSITLVCTEANTTWQAVDGSIGNIAIDGTTFNNALNQYSDRFEVGYDAKGVSGSTVPLAVQVDANSPTGIAVKNNTDGTDSAAVTNYQTDTGSVQGNVGVYGPSYSTSPNLAGRTVITSSGTSSEGTALRYDTGQNLLVLNADAIAATFDSDGVFTENVAVRSGQDVSGDPVTGTASDGSEFINIFQGRDDRAGLTRIFCTNEYENGTTSGARISVSTGVTGETSKVSGGIGAHSPNYTSIGGVAGRVVLYSDTPGVGAGVAITSLQNFTIATTNISSNLFTVKGTGERTIPKNPSCCAYLNATQANVTGDGTQYKIPYNAEVWDSGNNFNTTTNTFTAPVTGKYRIVATIGISGTNLGTTEFDIRFIASNRDWISQTLNPTNIGSPTNQARFNVSNLIDMDASDTVTVQVKGQNSGTNDLSVLGASNVFTSVTISLEH